jgi:hypothetical protein
MPPRALDRLSRAGGGRRSRIASAQSRARVKRSGTRVSSHTHARGRPPNSSPEHQPRLPRMFPSKTLAAGEVRSGPAVCGHPELHAGAVLAHADEERLRLRAEARRVRCRVGRGTRLPGELAAFERRRRALRAERRNGDDDEHGCHRDQNADIVSAWLQSHVGDDHEQHGVINPHVAEHACRGSC